MNHIHFEALGLEPVGADLLIFAFGCMVISGTALYAFEAFLDWRKRR